MNKKNRGVFLGCILSAALLMSANSWADNERDYEVTITNLTLGQPIAPVLLTSHRQGMLFFKAGEAPSDELASLAEAGDGGPMAEKLRGMRRINSVVMGEGGTPPGASSTVLVSGKPNNRISLAAMLGNTNDAFIALRNVKLPKGKKTVQYMATVYDAGSEHNDELCTTVPGPACGGEALSPNESGEGYVYIHNGIHGVGELRASDHDWNNPAAMITIKSVR